MAGKDNISNKIGLLKSQRILGVAVYHTSKLNLSFQTIFMMTLTSHSSQVVKDLELNTNRLNKPLSKKRCPTLASVLQIQDVMSSYSRKITMTTKVYLVMSWTQLRWENKKIEMLLFAPAKRKRVRLKLSSLNLIERSKSALGLSLTTRLYQPKTKSSKDSSTTSKIFSPKKRLRINNINSSNFPRQTNQPPRPPHLWKTMKLKILRKWVSYLNDSRLHLTQACSVCSHWLSWCAYVVSEASTKVTPHKRQGQHHSLKASLWKKFKDRSNPHRAIKRW